MPLSLRSTARASIALVLAFAQAGSAFAGTIAFTRDGLNGRSAMSFRGTRNVRATVPKGTKGDVLGRFALPSGNYAIKLKVTELGEGATSLAKGEEIWVYYHRDAGSRRVELFDDAGKPSEIDGGTWAIALSSFRTAKSEPTKAAAPCADCGVEKNLNPATIPVEAKPLEDLTKIAEAANEAPNLDVATEEVVAYIQNDRRKYGVAADEAAARAIAKTLIEECAKADPRVPLTLALAVMQQESHFSKSAKSRAGAMGLMQLMPDTYLGLSGQSRLSGAARTAAIREAWTPATNIRYGVKLLSQLLKRYGDDRLDLVAAAYNGGPGGAAKYAAGRAKRETRKYVPIVTGNIASAERALRTYVAYEKASGTSLEIAAVD